MTTPASTTIEMLDDLLDTIQSGQGHDAVLACWRDVRRQVQHLEEDLEALRREVHAAREPLLDAAQRAPRGGRGTAVRSGR